MKQLKKNVVIKSTLTQAIEYENPIEYQEYSDGTYYQNNNGTHYIVFENVMQDQKVISTLKLKDEELSLIKVGNVHMRYVFSPGRWNPCYYYLAGNSFLIRNYTKRLEYYLDEDYGSIQILYDLWSNDSHLGYYCWDFILS